VNTDGRPLGIDFDLDGNLIVADAFRGLLSISNETGAMTFQLAPINIMILSCICSANRQSVHPFSSDYY
jgi:hypothetical protein